jgi:hypothetical protein
MLISTIVLSTSAVPGPSTAALTSWRSGRPVLAQVTVSSSVATGTFSVQFCNQDLQIGSTVGSSLYPPTGGIAAPTSPIWTGLSSSPWLNSIGAAQTVYTASTVFPDGVCYAFPVPPAAIRLFSSALSSAALTLVVSQADGG